LDEIGIENLLNVFSLMPDLEKEKKATFKPATLSEEKDPDMIKLEAEMAEAERPLPPPAAAAAAAAAPFAATADAAPFAAADGVEEIEPCARCRKVRKGIVFCLSKGHIALPEQNGDAAPAAADAVEEADPQIENQAS
jgi:hypothetical protein